MADNTKIEWSEATWNPITGCSVVSPGCTNCYAMRLAGTRMKNHPSRAGLTVDTKAGPVWNGQVRLNEDWLTQPLQWQRPRMIFVCAHGDLFHESVPDEWIDRVFAVMALAPRHTFQVLTKRSRRMREYMKGLSCDGARRFQVAKAGCREANKRGFDGDLIESRIVDLGWPLPNVWLGVSVEDQKRADERIPDLLDTPAAVRWISAEPLLGPVDLERVRTQDGGTYNALHTFLDPDEALLHDTLDWIIASGESGPGARPMHPDWARSLRDQCAAAGVAFFFKQWGEWAPDDDGWQPRNAPLQFVRMNSAGEWTEGGQGLSKVGKSRAGRLLDGIEHNAFPKEAA